MQLADFYSFHSFFLNGKKKIKKISWKAAFHHFPVDVQLIEKKKFPRCL